jgi:hypothetical protein
MANLLFSSRLVLIELLNNWFELHEIALLDVSVCNKIARSLFSNCLESGIVVLNEAFNSTKLQDKQALIKSGKQYSSECLRLSFTKKKQMSYWILLRNISFRSIVVSGSYDSTTFWKEMFSISEKKSSTIIVQYFTEEYHSYDELANYINRSKNLLNLTLHSCLNMHDAQFMDINVPILRKLEQFICEKSPLRDHAVLYLADHCRNLQTFVYKAHENRSLKDTTVNLLFSCCKVLSNVFLDVRHFSDHILQDVPLTMKEMQINVTVINSCQTSVAAINNTLNRCKKLTWLRIYQLGGPKRNLALRIVFIILRNVEEKLITRLNVTSNCRWNTKQDLINLLKNCSNNCGNVSLKDFTFIDCELLSLISSLNSNMKKFWLTKCGHDYNENDLYTLLKCCPNLSLIKLKDCPSRVFTVNKFTTEFSEVEIHLTKLTAGRINEQWTNIDKNLINIGHVEDDDSDVECMYVDDLIEMI